MTFDPKEHFLKLKGKDYLPVAWRLVWFREEHPDWAITSSIIHHDIEGQWAVCQAVVSKVCQEAAADHLIPLAMGHKMESRKDFPDYLEKAETGAIGRALAALGYGTQFAPELEEGERIVDTPQPVKDYGNYRCEYVSEAGLPCNLIIMAQDGRPINATQADILRDRFGKLLCKMHR